YRDSGDISPCQFVHESVVVRVHTDAEALRGLDTVMVVEGVVGDSRNEMTFPAWCRGRMAKLGAASTPVGRRLGHAIRRVQCCHLSLITDSVKRTSQINRVDQLLTSRPDVIVSCDAA